jgi:hypothetical protein
MLGVWEKTGVGGLALGASVVGNAVVGDNGSNRSTTYVSSS